VDVVICGEVSESFLDKWKAAWSEVWNGRMALRVRRFQPPEPRPERADGAWEATDLLTRLPEGEMGSWVLGLAGRDLYAEGYPFVFGQAEWGGRKAVVSLYRLRPEWNGEVPDEGKWVQRAVKVGRHEMGHVWGLLHCGRLDCVMRSVRTVAAVDQQCAQFCDDCAAALAS
jgi:archaemetzincin